ncbi:nitrogenase iron-molybdenum cofactor biosynthesis protein NifE [Echinimonas agarilytica]|uniref:Nitrogenase iron-molybdenum cofactor biosynthesis protein NifE n=1 Tax=Echinimonas agarilytica TaxID=1215918 RepID=A0AA41W8L1_9GAMM|nr:nitrogenase iron-molybdenum cofactor biosynthesis protein NifE [Echinimonas agarilytica]MCM2680447.1 nitrogenase iron-molybdenum cofactor biosynthesis protein NifE [Echinimonas agarilytica]
MRNVELAELIDEPACEHNKGEKSGCSRPTPGATAGGCAFDGAQISLFPIADVAHIVHGPIACAGNSWNNRGTHANGRELFRYGFTTDLNEQDVIMGRSEKRLLHAIRTVVEKHAPPAVFVYTTCIPALEGDDVAAICKLAQDKWSIPVIMVDSAGFYGSKNLGNRIAGEVIIDQVVGTAEPSQKPMMLHRPEQPVHDIVLIGEYNIAGEFWYVAPLFAELGYRILCTLSGDSQFHQIQTMHRAQASMVVCSRAQINVARKLQQSWDIPWFEGSFYSMAETSSALRQFASLIGDPVLVEHTEAIIKREEAKVRAALAIYKKSLKGKKAVLYTGGVKAWSIVLALSELGIETVATGTKKSTEADKAKIEQIMGTDAIMLDEGGAGLIKVVEENNADFLIAGGRNQYTALKARLPFVDVNQERVHAYAGYRGMLNFAREIHRTLNSPVWQRVRSNAPWEK